VFLHAMCLRECLQRRHCRRLASRAKLMTTARSQIAACCRRFAYTEGDGKNLVEHYGHRLRHELIAQWRADPLPGVEQGLKSLEVSGPDTLQIDLVCTYVAAHPALHIRTLPGKLHSLIFSHC
jgi:hypothetical protein